MLDESIESSPRKRNRSIHHARVHRKIKRKEETMDSLLSNCDALPNQASNAGRQIFEDDAAVLQTKVDLRALYESEEEKLETRQQFGSSKSGFIVNYDLKHFDPFREEQLLLLADQVKLTPRLPVNIVATHSFVACNNKVFNTVKERSSEAISDEDDIINCEITDSELLKACEENEKDASNFHTEKESNSVLNQTPQQCKSKSVVEMILEDFCSSPMSPEPASPEENTICFKYANKCIRTYSRKRRSINTRKNIADQFESQLVEDDLISNGSSSSLSVQEDRSLTQVTNIPEIIDIHNSQNVCENLRNLSSYFSQVSQNTLQNETLINEEHLKAISKTSPIICSVEESDICDNEKANNLISIKSRPSTSSIDEPKDEISKITRAYSNALQETIKLGEEYPDSLDINSSRLPLKDGKEFRRNSSDDLRQEACKQNIAENDIDPTELKGNFLFDDDFEWNDVCDFTTTIQAQDFKQPATTLQNEENSYLARDSSFLKIGRYNKKDKNHAAEFPQSLKPLPKKQLDTRGSPPRDNWPDNFYVGFQTASRKQINVSRDAQDRASKILQNLPELFTHKDCLSNLTELKQLPCKSIDAAKETSERRSSLNKNEANQIHGSTNISVPLNNLMGFRTASCKSIHISKESQDRAVKILENMLELSTNKNERDEALLSSKETAECNTFMGFQTALSKPIIVSKVAQERASKMFADIPLKSGNILESLQKSNDTNEKYLSKSPIISDSNKAKVQDESPCNELNDKQIPHHGQRNESVDKGERLTEITETVLNKSSAYAVTEKKKIVRKSRRNKNINSIISSNDFITSKSVVVATAKAGSGKSSSCSSLVDIDNDEIRETTRRYSNALQEIIKLREKFPVSFDFDSSSMSSEEFYGFPCDVSDEDNYRNQAQNVILGSSALVTDASRQKTCQQNIEESVIDQMQHNVNLLFDDDYEWNDECDFITIDQVQEFEQSAAPLKHEEQINSRCDFFLKKISIEEVKNDAADIHRSKTPLPKNIDPRFKCMPYADMGFASNVAMVVTSEAQEKTAKFLHDFKHLDIRENPPGENYSKDNLCFGFQTASRKQIKVSKEAQQRAEKILQNLPELSTNQESSQSARKSIDSAKETLEPQSSLHKNRANQIHNSTNVNNLVGFTTASSKSIHISKETQDKTLLSSEGTTECNTFMGFKTALSKPVIVSKEAQQRAAKMFADISLESGNISVPHENCDSNKGNMQTLEAESVHDEISDVVFSEWPLEDECMEQKNSNSPNEVVAKTVKKRKLIDSDNEQPEKLVLNQIPKFICKSLSEPRSPLKHIGNGTVHSNLSELAIKTPPNYKAGSAIISRRNLLSLNRHSRDKKKSLTVSLKNKLTYTETPNKNMMFEEPTLPSRDCTPPGTPTTNLKEFFKSTAINTSTPHPQVSPGIIPRVRTRSQRSAAQQTISTSVAELELKPIDWEHDNSVGSCHNTSAISNTSDSNVVHMESNPTPKQRIARLTMYGKPPNLSPIYMSSTDNCRISGLRRRKQSMVKQ